MLSVNLGPLAIPANLALLYLGFFIAWMTGWIIGRKRGVNPESALFNMLLGGALVARIAFVVSYFEQYKAQPFGMLDIRDGGFLLIPGLIAAIVIGVLYAIWQRPLRTPLSIGVVVGAMIWGAGISLLSAFESSQSIPELALRDLQGNPVALHELDDKPLVVNLWATWCPPCRREMPVLEAAQKANPDVRFVYVNQGEGQELVADFLLQQQLELSGVLLDSGARAGQAVGSRSLPTTLFYNSGGQLQHSHLGELSNASLDHSLKHIKASAK